MKDIATEDKDTNINADIETENNSKNKKDVFAGIFLWIAIIISLSIFGHAIDLLLKSS